ncbi:MAG: TlpA disulfide reductase family protein [Minisyncoccia bacterium]
MQNAISTHKKTIALLSAILIVLGLLTYSFVSPRGFFSGLSNDLKKIEQEGQFMYADLEGNQISLVDYKGKPLIINSWATWIPFSQAEFKLIESLNASLGNEVTILAINRKEDRATIKAYLDFIGNPQGIVFLSDVTDNFYKTIGGYATPETVFYDRNGVIVGHKHGVLTVDELKNYIELLKLEE